MRLNTSNIWNFQGVLHTLAATEEVPRYTRLHSRGSTRVPGTSRGAPFLPSNSRGGILSLRGRERIPGVPSHLKRRRSPRERREELQGRATIPRIPQISQSITGKPVFPALRRFSSRGSTHTTVARGTALWESLMGKPPGIASRESHISIDAREGKRDTAATALEESALACPHSRRGLTPLGRLQKYPKIHVSTGEESSGSDTHSHTRSQAPASPGEESREAPEQLAWGLAFPEATRAGP